MTILVTGLEMEQLLGAGHYGEVYLAKDPVHGHVAAKMMSRFAGEADDAWRARREGLLQEAQHLSAALQRAFDQGPMKQLLDVRRIATEVTFGLRALHQRGMLHRDIKPANILLDAESRALLGDFGWVTDEIFLGYAHAGGYRDHLAYEAWSSGAASVKTDVWALGMTLYRLLHGKNWYGRQGTPRFEIKNGRFADSLEWLPHIPAKWRRVVRQMMADDTSILGDARRGDTDIRLHLSRGHGLMGRTAR
jgi:eukaryotic-like serine/threonine-protein kinase